MLIVLMLLSISYFLFLTQWFMPKYSFAVIGHLQDYKLLGNTPPEVIKNIVSHPVNILEALFTNHVGAQGGDFLKSEFLLLLIISGGWIFFFRPVYLWMCIPLFAQKFLTDNPQFWGLGGQYSIEFVPVIVIGIYDLFSSMMLKFEERKITFFTTPKIKALAFLSSILCIASTIRVMDHTKAFIDHAAIRFYQPMHYAGQVRRENVIAAMEFIPGAARLSAQTHLAPHAALRKSLYLFPQINDAEFILLQLNGESFYPITKQVLIDRKDSLLLTGEWKVAWEKDSLLILQKEI